MLLIDPSKLSVLLGHHLMYRGEVYCVIDILDESPALVLQACDDWRGIQTNQYGEASRRALRVITVPLFNVRRDSLNPALADLAEVL